MALLIRRSSVRARRGPPGVFAWTFALLTGLRSASYPPELPRCACRVDGESGIWNPQVVDTSPTRPTPSLRRSDSLRTLRQSSRSKPLNFRGPQRVRTSQSGRVKHLSDGVDGVYEEPYYLVQVSAVNSRPSIDCIALTFAPDASAKASSFFARSRKREPKSI